MEFFYVIVSGGTCGSVAGKLQEELSSQAVNRGRNKSEGGTYDRNTDGGTDAGTLLDAMEQHTLNACEHNDETRPDWQPIKDALRRLVGDASPCADPPVVQAAQAFGAACFDYVMTQKQEPERF